MSKHTPTQTHGSMGMYVSGYALSLVLTFFAFSLVTRHMLAGWTLVYALLALGVVQLMVQLVFFLHLGAESRPRWNVMVFLFMLLMLVILVFGSLWIMKNLNTHMLSPAQETKSVMDDEGIHR